MQRIKSRENWGVKKKNISLKIAGLFGGDIRNSQVDKSSGKRKRHYEKGGDDHFSTKTSEFSSRSSVTLQELKKVLL